MLKNALQQPHNFTRVRQSQTKPSATAPRCTQQRAAFCKLLSQMIRLSEVFEFLVFISLLTKQLFIYLF